MNQDTVVLSLGGSIIVPHEIDVGFIERFKDLILNLKDRKFILVCGGGKVCRKYQDAAKSLGGILERDLDWIGIRSTQLNAELIRAILGSEAFERIIHDPDEEIETDKRIIIGGGFRPGSSTDLRAVQLAVRFGASKIINMSNIDYVYSADPKNDPGAKRMPTVSWAEFRKLVGNEWDPGLNMPFDPIASKEAERARLNVIVVGNDTDNLEKLLRGENFEGTTIS